MKKRDFFNVLLPICTIVLCAWLLSFLGKINLIYLLVIGSLFLLGQIFIFWRKKSKGLMATTSISSLLATINVLTAFIIQNNNDAEWPANIFLISLGIYFFIIVFPALSKKDYCLY